jgi:hypothetical protein
MVAAEIGLVRSRLHGRWNGSRRGPERDSPSREGSFSSKRWTPDAAQRAALPWVPGSAASSCPSSPEDLLELFGGAFEVAKQGGPVGT